MAIREAILRCLASSPEGCSVQRVAKDLELDRSGEGLATVEAFLLLSPECYQEGDHWRVRSTNRRARLLSELQRYADSSGRRIFRLSTALGDVAPHEHPTEDELAGILEGSEFELLPNAMIKRVSG